MARSPALNPDKIFVDKICMVKFSLTAKAPQRMNDSAL